MRADYLTSDQEPASQPSSQPREGEKTWHDHVDSDDDVVDFFPSTLYWLWHSLFIIIIIFIITTSMLLLLLLLVQLMELA